VKAIPRTLEKQLQRAARSFSAMVLTGPRRAGKTYCLRRVFPKHSYRLLESPDELARAKVDPRAWLESLKLPVILDEVQNAPELFPYVRALIDKAPSAKGRWVLTGSQDFSLMQGVSESMAGRAAVFRLYPLSMSELGRWDLLRGGYPEVWAKPTSRDLWFQSYIQTYLERDVRDVLAVRDLASFRRFLSLAALANGQMLNKSSMAAPLGVSVPTIAQWLSVLETTGLITLVPAYFNNFQKRLLKSPRLYWLDTGLLCALLGMQTLADLERSPLVGSVFESFVASEIIKAQVSRGGSPELFYFRDQQGLEVDLLVPLPRGRLGLFEVKWSKTPAPKHAAPLKSLLSAVSQPTLPIVIHRPGRTLNDDPKPLGGSVQAFTVDRFIRDFTQGLL
jgi:uncharacterized protein